MNMKLLIVFAVIFTAPNIAVAQISVGSDTPTSRQALEKPKDFNPQKANPQKANTLGANVPAQSRKKPQTDLDSFFKEAEEQTREAQEHSGPGCVPKADPKESKPIS